MSYCVNAVRYRGETLVALQLVEGDGTDTGWVKKPHEATVDDVVSRIHRGDVVQALLTEKDEARSNPHLKIVPGAQGGKSLALDNAPIDCLELSDLPGF